DHGDDLLQQRRMDERAFLSGAAHGLTLGPLTLLWTAANDHQAGLLVAAGAVAERRLAPGSLRIPPGAGAALAATVWVVERGHGHAAHPPALAAPAALARLAHVLVLVFHVAHLADGGVAVPRHPP